jgi:hypothetical protein
VFYCLETLAASRSRAEAIIAKRGIFGKGGAMYLVAVMLLSFLSP